MLTYLSSLNSRPYAKDNLRIPFTRFYIKVGRVSQTPAKNTCVHVVPPKGIHEIGVKFQHKTKFLNLLLISTVITLICVLYMSVNLGTWPYLFIFFSNLISVVAELLCKRKTAWTFLCIEYC